LPPAYHARLSSPQSVDTLHLVGTRLTAEILLDAGTNGKSIYRARFFLLRTSGNYPSLATFTLTASGWCGQGNAHPHLKNGTLRSGHWQHCEASSGFGNSPFGRPNSLGRRIAISFVKRP